MPGDVKRVRPSKRRGATIAQAIGAQPDELVFTSGATESNNLAIRGLADRLGSGGKHLVSVATEHRAVLDPLEQLRRRGCRRQLGCRCTAARRLRRAGWTCSSWPRPIQDDTILVSVMLANNEIGVIQPLAAIGRHLRRSAACCCTPTPLRRSARSPSTWPTGRRSDELLGPQDLRPQRDRCAVRPPSLAADPPGSRSSMAEDRKRGSGAAR